MLTTPNTQKIKHHPAWASLAQVASDDIERLLEHFFSATDNLLYDLSKRASSNSESAFYFDAMREMRTVRNLCIDTFLQKLTQQAIALAAGELSSTPTDDDLNVLPTEELDRVLARQTVVNNIGNLYHPDWQLLKRRLTQLSPLDNIPSEQIPFGPQWLAQNFADCIPLMSGKIIVILFKQLEKHLLRQLAPLITQCNDFLIREGLIEAQPASTPLPKLSEIVTSLDDPTPAIYTPSEFTLPLHSLRQILANARFKAANDDALGYRYAFNPGPIIPLPVFSTGLTQQQLKEANLIEFPLKNNVGDYVSRALAGEDSQEPCALNPYHEDIIQLVESFFDELLDDSELTTVTQSLVCRLQIPVLKVALRNERFFSDANHPARSYLNLLTLISQTLASPEKPEEDPLYEKLLSGVKRINKLFDLNEDVFDNELESLSVLEQQEANRAQIIERRTRQAEEGRQRFNNAKSAAQECINHHTKTLKLHPSTQQFIHEYWQQVLVLTFLKEGQGPLWLSHGQTLNDLLWLDQEHADTRAQQRAIEVLAHLKSKLMAGLTLLHLDDEQCQTLCDKVLQGTSAKCARTPLANQRPTAIEKQQQDLVELEQHFFNIAKNMKTDTWLKFTTTNSSVVCKLASNTSPENFLFVNRLGSKALTKTRKELALALQQGQAKIMVREPLFDRLMNRTLKHLKKSV